MGRRGSGIVFPTDDELWARRLSFSASTCAIGLKTTADVVRDNCRRRGWDFDTNRAHHQRLNFAPCMKCGKSFAIEQQKDRLCDKCTPVETPREWEANLRWGRMRHAQYLARKEDERNG